LDAPTALTSLLTDVGREPAIDLYRQMKRIRDFEERVAALYSEWEMRCPVHLCVGQEAAEVGVTAALERGDKVLGAHRSHGHYLAKGGDMRAMLAELYGKATGCTGGKGGSMHLVDLEAGFVAATPVIGSTIPIAAGVAWASAMRGERTVTVSFFGDAATEEGIFHETLLFAVLKKLPVVFVCENNLYSVYSPLSVRQPEERDLVGMSRAAGAAAAAADGNDVLAVNRLAREAVDRARSGHGPTVLEFATYRWREHCGPLYDDDVPYRPDGELDRWKARDPVASYRARLLDGVADEAELDEIDAQAADEMDAAVRFAKESPFPPAEEFATHVYAG
jgi:TPP-dependent pyruvate/acetoin dehydrogenase alpha subunit